MDTKITLLQEDGKVYIPAGGLVFFCDAPVATDGYQARALWLLESAVITGAPPEEASRYLATAQRHCDSAHRQLVRVREAIATYAAAEPEEKLTLLNQIIGDAEMAISAIHLATKMAASLPGLYRVREAPVPAVIARRKDDVAALRHAFEHIDERARGRVNKMPDSSALGIFQFYRLIEHGEIS